MKKSLYFIALIVILGAFLAKVDVSHAYTSEFFNVYDDGIAPPNNWYLLPNIPCANSTDNTYATFYFGAPASGTELYSNSGHTCASLMTIAAAEYQLILYPTLGDGDYYWLIHDYVSPQDFYYFPLNFTTGIDWTPLSYSPPTATITSPANNSTITDLSTTLEISYANLDYTNFPYLYVGFIDDKIGMWSEAKKTILTASSGSLSIPFSDFNIIRNGYWTIYITQWSSLYTGYGSETSYPLSPVITYKLNFNIDGLPTPYTFTDWATWYSENASGTPSVWTTSMLGFLQPIFEKIGEFGERITTYLNTSDAYNKGNSLGSVFPVVIAYVNKINLFFGGFPIVQFFQWLIITMIGIFAIKIILKLLSFIPFFGGGG